MSIKTQIATLPPKPGVYLFKDSRGEILYVGKAKSLRSRVQSYFRPAAKLEPLKQKMIKRVATIDTINCDTENEALILEANLIHQHQPPYNVVLRDDKYFLFIKITTNEKIPRVFLVRRLKRDGARYFGPYSSATAARTTLKLLRRIFPHPNEKSTSRDQIFPHPLFNTSQTNSPSIDTKSPRNITQIIRFLRGDRQAVIHRLQQGIKQASRLKQYERAALFRDQLQAITKLDKSPKVYLSTQESFDIISLSQQPRMSAANVFMVRQGKLLYKNTFLLKHRAAEETTTILRQFILQYYRLAQDIPHLILLPTSLPDQTTIATYINQQRPPILKVPQRGPKKQLLQLGTANARQLLNQEALHLTSYTSRQQALSELSTAIYLPSIKLSRIETYDISNIQGKLATGSMVVFTDGQPNKNQYRKFKIRLNETPNDYAMLQEVLLRRFSKRHQDWPLPDLILIDGGRGQLNAAQHILKQLKLDIPLASLAKRAETLHFYQPNSLRPSIKNTNFPYDSPALFLLQQMRDEAHRFTITYHRLLHRRLAHRSILDEIPGLGPKTKKKLLNHFGSLKAIRAATDHDLQQLIGPQLTKSLRDWL